jgi:hypothetical protein
LCPLKDKDFDGTSDIHLHGELLNHSRQRRRRRLDDPKGSQNQNSAAKKKERHHDDSRAEYADCLHIKFHRENGNEQASHDQRRYQDEEDD